MLRRKRLWLFVLVSSLLILLVPACGGGEETTAPPATSTATATLTPAPTGPIKIGAINSWSGPAAVSGLALADPCIKVVEKKVKDSGGILGGREVQVIRYDNRASVAEAQAGATKLYYDDKVSVLVFGGVGEAEFEGVADFAQEHQILYVGL